jgi:hypothetical protein
MRAKFLPVVRLSLGDAEVDKFHGFRMTQFTVATLSDIPFPPLAAESRRYSGQGPIRAELSQEPACDGGRDKSGCGEYIRARRRFGGESLAAGGGAIAVSKTAAPLVRR